MIKITILQIIFERNKKENRLGNMILVHWHIIYCTFVAGEIVVNCVTIQPRPGELPTIEEAISELSLPQFGKMGLPMNPT